eukprot:TRINITY_DN10686_c0_g1_i6.p1 TRINITY_DN10686_c0_g1~~TRINITY_DN10686_c0_g1_i6.p1  ORF type:complete len:126 (+),score=12.45 TRINITY_DN10686_c0_g1_i6:174-551(+)
MRQCEVRAAFKGHQPAAAAPTSLSSPITRAWRRWAGCHDKAAAAAASIVAYDRNVHHCIHCAGAVWRDLSHSFESSFISCPFGSVHNDLAVEWTVFLSSPFIVEMTCILRSERSCGGGPWTTSMM